MTGGMVTGGGGDGLGGAGGGGGGGAAGGGMAGGGVPTPMHDARSSIMNSSTFSCAVIGPVQYSGVVPLAGWLTWKPLNTTRPHCWSAGEPTGVLNENSWANWCWMQLALDCGLVLQSTAVLPANCRQASGELSHN